MLVKIYGASSEGAKGRYSPAECIGAQKHRIEGKPDMKHVSTSYSERANLTMRMHNRRFTRLTKAFSKKFENHAHMVNGTVVRVPILEHVPPDTGAAWNLMKNLEPDAWRDKIETQVNNTFSLADLVALSMQQRARKAEQAKLIEVQANQAENEE
jgi:hypothetical protein